MDSSSPNPIAHFADDTELDSLLVPERYLLVTACHQHVLPSRVEADRARVKAKFLVSADSLDSFTAAN